MSNGNVAENRGAVRPTLFIGLGGTGKEVLLRLRRRFYERFGAPGLPCTSYLWLDTDTRNVMAQGEKMDDAHSSVMFQPDAETVGLLAGSVGQDLGGVLENDSSHVHRWLHREVGRYGREISDGAGGVRAVGRLCWVRRFPAIQERISSAYEALRTQGAMNATKNILGPEVQYDTTPQAWIVCSLAGGTGSGTVLDTAFLLSRLKFESIYGMLVLPNVYFSIGNPGEVGQRSFGNGYAALKELEHYVLNVDDSKPDPSQGRRFNSAPFVVEWEAGRTLEVGGPPFSAAYIIERENERGTLAHERRELFRMLAESLYLDFMPGSFSNAKRSEYSNAKELLSGVHQQVTQQGGPAPESVEDIEYSGEDVTLNQRFSRRYATLGMSKMAVPREQLRVACAAQLASSIASWWAREGIDPNVREAVDQEASAHRFHPDQIFERFPVQWRQQIESHYEQQVRGKLSVRTREDVERFATALALSEETVARSDGADPMRWGYAVVAVRNSTNAQTAEVRNDIEGWLDTCLRNPSRGLASVVADGGYLDYLNRVFKSTYQPGENQEPSHAERRRQEAEADAADAVSVRECLVQQLREAVRSRRLKLIAALDWTLDVLVQKAIDASRRRAVAMTSAALWGEVEKVARGATQHLTALSQALKAVQPKLLNLKERFQARKREFLSFHDDNLFTFVYDPEHDWPEYYALGWDDRLQQRKAVDKEAEKAEAERFLAQRQKPSLMALLEDLRKQGEQSVADALQQHTETRFADDFTANPRVTNILEHPQVQQSMAAFVDRLVTGAYPMTKRDAHLKDRSVGVVRAAYLGVADENEAREFIEQVQKRVPEVKVQAQSSGDPTAVYLYMVTYAFPLASLPLVSQHLHDTYHAVYRSMRAGREGGGQHLQVPLHLDVRWEGKFPELRIYSDTEARSIRRALEFLLVAPAVRTITAQPAASGVEFVYRKDERPRPVPVVLGNPQHSVEVLRQDAPLLSALEQLLSKRIASLCLADQELLYWCLAYAKERTARGTPEQQVLAQLTNKAGDRLEAAMPGVDLEVPEGEAAASYIDQKLGDRVDRLADFRILKLDPDVLPRAGKA